MRFAGSPAGLKDLIYYPVDFALTSMLHRYNGAGSRTCTRTHDLRWTIDRKIMRCRMWTLWYRSGHCPRAQPPRKQDTFPPLPSRIPFTN